MYYYFTNSNISKYIPPLRKYNISWAAFDKNNANADHNHKLNKFLSANIDNSQFHIIHGFANDNIFDPKNLSVIKTMVENKFGRANIIYNNIKPRAKYPTNKIMLINAILSLSSLTTNGLLITKILEPEYWTGTFINYIILLAYLFNKTEIFRFPVCKNNTSYFRYYMACYHKKNLVYNGTICSKLMYALNQDDIEQPILVDSIISTDIIKLYIQKIENIQKKFMAVANPTEALHANIFSLNDLL